MRNLKVIGKAFVDVYDNMFVLLLVNIIWLLLAALPVSGIISMAQVAQESADTGAGAAIFLFVMAALLVLLAGPPTYAMAVLLRGVTEYEAFGVRDFINAIRQHYRRAWVMGFVALVVTALLLVNLVFYATLGGWGTALVPLFALILLLWLMMQMYIYPIAVITEGGPRRVLRNAAIIVFRHPGLSLLTAIVSLILIVVSSLLIIPWVIVTTSALIALATRAVRSAVRRDFGLPEEDPLVNEPLPPILAEEEGGRTPLPHYGWRSGRREAGDEEPNA